MTDPMVRVDANLVEAAAAVAAARGERIEDVITRALAQYIESPREPSHVTHRS